MTQAGILTVNTPSDLEISLTRDFNAPRELVFDAFTKPDLLRRWHTGDGAVMEICDVNLRAGGSYRYVWKMSQGQMGMGGEFLEVVPSRSASWPPSCMTSPGIQAAAWLRHCSTNPETGRAWRLHNQV